MGYSRRTGRIGPGAGPERSFSLALPTAAVLCFFHLEVTLLLQAELSGNNT
jgi:hypothetical protein